MDKLFSKNVDFHDDVLRNIVSLRKTEDLFDDINDADEDLSNLANAVESLVKKEIPHGMIAEDFHYSTAITYPFKTEPFMASRYSDGTFGIWYGSLELETTIFETVYHMIQMESQIENLNEVIIRERAVYKVYCEAILMDFRKRQDHYPELIANEYYFTQKIGQKLHKEGHPGLLAPSARHTGSNIVAFNPNILSNPRNYCYLTYIFYPETEEVFVERTPGKTLLKISKNHFDQQRRSEFLVPNTM